MSAATAAGRLTAPVPRKVWALLLAVVAVALYVAFAGQFTLPHDNDAPMFQRINDIREWVDANRNSNIILVIFVNGVRGGITALFDVFMLILHGLSWPGLTAIGAILGFAVGRWRLAALVTTGFLSFGVLGLWERSVDTLALTLAAVVISLAIGIPLGIAAGRSDRFMNALRPILDVMQIMPTFAYLAPFTLFFLIGPATAAIVTMIYAVPPAIRITALGIRSVAPASVEAATSLGSTSRQLLSKVQLPMARRTIILGINQTIMMALSMVVITALIDAPGLGKNIIKALQINDVGLAFDAGLAIVIMAIMLDRLTTQASERLDPAKPGGPIAIFGRTGRAAAAIALGICAAAVAAGNLALGGDLFPKDLHFSFRTPINDIVGWVALNLYDVTEGIKNVTTYGLINPIQTVLTSAPWWLVAIVIIGIAVLASGPRVAIITAACLGILATFEMWEHGMQTLTAVMVATILTLVVGLLFGVLSARSDRFSMVLRPLLDAAQTMPAFVYLLPAVALFGPTRFTGIVAALIYAVPPVIRLVEIGVRTVSAPVREAAVSAGTTPRQLLFKVELPLARPALLVAANQGIILVLAMVVVGGLVGGGALGYDVVAGFARRDFFGEGLAAGIAIVALGIMLDRITQGAGSGQRESLLPGGASRVPGG
ncbi:MAG: ABC transporter permease subunit [Candidatus Limnocylindrales bacterium]